MRGYLGVVDIRLGPRGLGKWFTSGSQRLLTAQPDGSGGYELWAVGQSAGLKGGDRQRIAVKLDAGSRLSWEPVAAEHLLPGQGPAVSLLRFRVGSSSRLYWASFPVIPHPGSRLRRCTVLRAPQDAWVGVEEWVTGGRVARGELWHETSLDLESRVVWGPHRWHERMVVENQAAVDGAEAVWSFWLMASPELAEGLKSRLEAMTQVYASQVALAPGAVLARVLGSESAVAEAVMALRAWVRPRLLQSCW
ncbi:MAG: urease accessory protein UreD [Firmicutes bacterium]|nr:urease accessory protein UreD [Bacillota bacterium]